MTHAADTTDICTSLIERIDWTMQRAKVAPDAARRIEAARNEAMAHKAAGRNDACIEAARKALAIIGG
jgi:hypothetical protein